MTIDAIDCHVVSSQEHPRLRTYKAGVLRAHKGEDWGTSGAPLAAEAAECVLNHSFFHLPLSLRGAARSS